MSKLKFPSQPLVNKEIVFLVLFTKRCEDKAEFLLCQAGKLMFSFYLNSLESAESKMTSAEMCSNSLDMRHFSGNSGGKCKLFFLELDD